MHGAVITRSPGKQPGIDASQSRNALSREPFVRATACRVMALHLNVIRNHQALDRNSAPFVRPVQDSGPPALRYLAFAYQQIGQDSHLAAVGGFGDGFHILAQSVLLMTTHLELAPSFRIQSSAPASRRRVSTWPSRYERRPNVLPDISAHPDRPWRHFAPTTENTSLAISLAINALPSSAK